MSKRMLLVLLAVLLILVCSCAGALLGAGVLWMARQTPVATQVVPAETPSAETPSSATPSSSPVPESTPAGGNKEGKLTPRPSQPQVQGGGTLRLWGSLPPTLDPAMVQDTTSSFYVTHLFSGLVRLTADLEIVPDLASEWSLENDGLTYVFRLNPEATFADGSPLTAEHVRRSWERACSPALDSPVALAYLQDIVGAGEYARGQADRIVGLEVRDAHTLAVTIDSYKSYFLAKLTYPTALVVDVDQAEADPDGWMLDPNVSGPFQLQSVTQSQIVFSRNPRYHGSPPQLERVEIVLDGGLPITMYENDRLDIVDVWADELDRVTDPYNPLHTELHVASELSVDYLAMDVTRPPFDDPLVRQAIFFAIDREKLASLVLNNTALPARGIVPPALVQAEADAAAALMVYDPDKARRLLQESRYSQPGAMPEVVLSISGTSGYLPEETEAVLAMLEENLGLVVTVEQIDWPDFLQDLNSRRYAFYASGWMADYPDQQNFLDLLFHSDSPQNHVGYSNAEVDRLLEQARVELNAVERARLYGQAELLILQDAPWVPLTHGEAYTLVKPRVGGYRSSASLYPWLLDVYLQE
ncbi:MAG: peptide ABC transporter substrate-binding protein [Anaerolineae bacterium]|jgi:oligopeptide transport system substrate-binding protein|nr:peptide ABC transporter substrate-binding protein [Chloroflexota bacterium]